MNDCLERDQQQQRPKLERQDSIKSESSSTQTTNATPSEPIKIVIPKLFTTPAFDPNSAKVSSDIEEFDNGEEQVRRATTS